MAGSVNTYLGQDRSSLDHRPAHCAAGSSLPGNTPLLLIQISHLHQFSAREGLSCKCFNLHFLILKMTLNTSSYADELFKVLLKTACSQPLLFS